MIDWKDPSCKISRHFTVREALWLPRWDRMANVDDGLSPAAQGALIFLFQKMDLVRDFIGRPIIVHNAFRPEKYNAEVGGSKVSCHMARMWGDIPLAAVDWHANIPGETQGGSCDVIREAIIPKLAEWDLRAENNAHGAAWIHIDTKPVLSGSSRYFKP